MFSLSLHHDKSYAYRAPYYGGSLRQSGSPLKVEELIGLTLSFLNALRRSRFVWLALRRFVQDRQDFRAHEHVGVGEIHCESRGHFARRCCLCRLRQDGCDALCWSLVGYTLKAFQLVFGPDLGEFHCESRGHFAHRGCLCRLREDGCDALCWSLVDYTLKAFQLVSGPYLGKFHCESRGHFARRGCLCRICESGCDARYWSLVGYSLKALQVVHEPTGASFYLVAMMVTAAVVAELVAEINQDRAMCTFLQYIVSCGCTQTLVNPLFDQRVGAVREEPTSCRHPTRFRTKL